MRFAAMSKSPERATLNFSDPGFSGVAVRVLALLLKSQLQQRKTTSS